MKSLTAKFAITTLLCAFTLDQASSPAQSLETWTFAVSGDSRNCGDIIMPGIAEGVRTDKARFYWHLGDYRANYDFDQDLSLALPGHSFQVLALDGNPVPNPATVPVLWIGTGERISAMVHMQHPGVWILGDLDDGDRGHGMGIVVEYAGRTGKPQWVAPPAFKWSYARFAKLGATPPSPEEEFEMTFAKANAAEDGFNLWTINGVAFHMSARRARRLVMFYRVNSLCAFHRTIAAELLGDLMVEVRHSDSRRLT